MNECSTISLVLHPISRRTTPFLLPRILEQNVKLAYTSRQEWNGKDNKAYNGSKASNKHQTYNRRFNVSGRIKKMEIRDLYTKDRQKTGETMVRGGYQPPNSYKLTVRVCVFNKNGELLIQKRQISKSTWASYWDLTISGSVISGETSQDAAERELEEEIGLKESFAEKRPTLTVHSDLGFDDIFIIEKDIDPSNLQLFSDEVSHVKWADFDDVLEMIKDGIFIPYHPAFIEILFFLRNQRSVRTRLEKKEK